MQSRLIHKMTSILVAVGFRKYCKNSDCIAISTIYSGNMILLDCILTRKYNKILLSTSESFSERPSLLGKTLCVQ